MVRARWDNLFYRLNGEETSLSRPAFDERGEWVPLGIEATNLGRQYFLVTGSGRYMRNVALDPAQNLCIVRLDETRTKYQKVWGLVSGGRPTSERFTHIRPMSSR